MLLVLEMALFMLLMVPMPFRMKRKLFTYVLPLIVARRLTCFAASSRRAL